MNSTESQQMLALVARLVADNAELVAKNARLAVELKAERIGRRAEKEALVADRTLCLDAMKRRDAIIKKLRERGDYHKAQSAKWRKEADDMDDLYQETAENLACEVEFKTGGYNDDGEYVWDLRKDDVEFYYEEPCEVATMLDAIEAKPTEYWCDGMKFLDAESMDDYKRGRDIIDYGRNDE